MTSWVKRPEFNGRSSMAYTGIGMDFCDRGSECRDENLSEMWEFVAPESINANVLIGLCPGKFNSMGTKK